MNLDDAFWPALWSLSTSVGTRPETLLAVWFAESGLNPAAKNSIGCLGLNQTCPREIGGPGFPNDDAEAYAQAPASQQLAWIAHQVTSAALLNGGPFLSAARYYQANYLPATLRTAKGPTDPIAAKAGPNAIAYKANTVLDANGDGAITLDDLGHYLEKRIAANGVPLRTAIATAYAEKPAEAPWTAPHLVLFEPSAAPVAQNTPRTRTLASVGASVGGGGAFLAGLALFALVWRRA
jgi:hypothetical protein